MRTKFKNIPVKEETYEKVKVIAEANGLGSRGMGAQVDNWVARELPECEHPKIAVDIQLFPSQDSLAGEHLHRTGWFCATCNRVYQRIERLNQLLSVEEPDPYVQAISSTNHVRSAIRNAEAQKLADQSKTTKKRRQRVGRDF